MVSIGAVIGGGFRLFREQPVALAIWAVVGTLYSTATSLLLMQVQRAAAYGSASDIVPTFLVYYVPFYLLAIVFSVAITTAAFHAVMRPAERRVGFLRVGMDELRVLGMGTLWFLVFLIFYVLMVAMVIVLGRMIYADGYGPQGFGIIPLLLVLLAPVYCPMIWLHVRLSPVLPLIVLRRRFAIGEAWRMTKGEVWPLLGGYAAIMLIGLVATIAAYAVAVGPYLGALARGASSNMATEAIAGIGPLTVIGWIVNGVVVAIIYAMWAGSVGTATYQLIGAEGGGVNYAETFG